MRRPRKASDLSTSSDNLLPTGDKNLSEAVAYVKIVYFQIQAFQYRTIH